MKPFTSKHCTPLYHGSHRISVDKDGVSHKHDGAGNTIDKKPYENRVNYSDKIEKIASKVLKSESIFSVVDDNKKVIGSLSKKELIRALFAEDKNE